MAREAALARVHNDYRDAVRGLHDEARDVDEWYAGVTNDPQRRLKEHAVDPDEGDYTWVECTDADVAADAEAELHELGYQGGPGGSQKDTVFVYVYEITDDTCETC